MPDLSLQEILLVGLLSGGIAHPYGHVATGNEQNVPVTIDWKNRTEPTRFSGDPTKDAQVYGGGFAMQDLLGQASQNPNMRMANGLYKLGYLSKLTLPKGGGPGDVDSMERLSGNKYTKPLLGASAAMDLYKAYNPNDRWDVQFITPNGSPGLMWRYNF